MSQPLFVVLPTYFPARRSAVGRIFPRQALCRGPQGPLCLVCTHEAHLQQGTCTETWDSGAAAEREAGSILTSCAGRERRHSPILLSRNGAPARAQRSGSCGKRTSKRAGEIFAVRRKWSQADFARTRGSGGAGAMDESAILALEVHPRLYPRPVFGYFLQGQKVPRRKATPCRPFLLALSKEMGSGKAVL